MFFRKKPSPNLGTTRIEAFSDGVFSIAITLLVLEIAIPTLTHTQLAHGELAAQLFDLWPKVLSYIISFAVIGIFWVGHNIMFHFIKKSDRTFLWLNILFLMAISFIPFPAALLGEYAPEITSVVLYGVVLCVAGILMNGMWSYATYNHRLVDSHLSTEFLKKARFVLLVAPVTYVIAVAFAFVHPTITLLLYALVPVVYILPSPIDELIEEIQ